MSSRDGSSLSEHERAILDGLAAKAAADDPTLAAALRGRHRSLTLRLPGVPPPLRHWAVGVAVAMIGLVVVLVSLGSSLVLGIVGVVLTFAGTGQVVATAPWMPGRSAPDPGPAPPES